MASASKQFEVKALREKRGKIRVDIEAIGTAMKAESRAMTPEEKSAFDKLKTDFAAVSETIRMAEASIKEIDDLLGGAGGGGEGDAPVADPAADGGANSAGRGGVDHRQKPQDQARASNDKRLAFRAWLRGQHGVRPTADEAAACKRTGLNPKAKAWDIRLGDPSTRANRGIQTQKRALTVTTTAGGYLIKQDFSDMLEETLVSYSNVRGIADELQTETGAPLPYPTENDTTNTGELLSINTEVAYADPAFASVTFAAYKFSSKGVIVPWELIQDSEFDIDSMVSKEIGIRIGRIEGSYFTTGTGTNEPKGVVTCAAAGITTASATAFTADELTRLMFSVDRAYRDSPKVGYMMKDDVIGYCALLKDSNGRPLLREGHDSSPTDFVINAKPVYANQFMTGLTSAIPVTATKHVLFGDFSKFKIRDAGPVRLKRLDERWAEKDQVGFIAFHRSDSNCVNTAAIKYLLQA